MPTNVEFDEINGGGTRTHAVSNMNYGNRDAANIIPSALTGIKPGTCAYVKYHQIHFTEITPGSTIGNLRLWMSPGAAGAFVATNLGEAGRYLPTLFSVPTRDKWYANTMPRDVVATANLGIGGLLSGTLTTSGYSDLFKWQVQTSTTTPRGALGTITTTVAWDEVYA